MKKLQCEICGGSLVMQEGMAICESCGMKFSKEEVKKMVVELSGPVEIKGPVELVKGDEEKNRLLENAERLIEAGAVEEAAKLFRRVTEEYPTEYQGWFGCWRCGAIPGIPAPELTWRDIALHDVQQASFYAEYECYQKPIKSYADVCFPTNFEHEYEMALSLAPEDKKEYLQQFREQYYTHPRQEMKQYDAMIQKYVQESTRNAGRLGILWKKHNYHRCFRETLDEHAAFLCYHDRYIHSYIDQWVSFSEYSTSAYCIHVPVPADRMDELEDLALERHNNYIRQRRCPHCLKHPPLDFLGRCKNAKNNKLHGAVKILKKTDKE